MKRPLVIISGILIVLVAGLIVYVHPWARPASQQADPAIVIAFSVGVLERDPSIQLSADQVKRMLPYLRVLRDTDPSDLEASRALADEIRTILTPAQREALGRLRERIRGQRLGENPPGSLEASPGQGRQGPGRAGVDQAAFRRQILGRLIQRLEIRLNSSSS